MAGHSKWANIKHKKAATDKKRSAVFSKLAKLIQVAAKSGGDLNANPTLRTMVENAKAQGLPAANIERAIKRGTGEDKDAAQLEANVYEASGPGGTAFVIESLTDNRNRTVSDIRHILSKAGGELGASGSAMWQFKRIGLVEVPTPNDMDEFELAAIDLGADDFESGEGSLYIETAPENLNKLSEGLRSLGHTVLNGELIYKPTSPLSVSDAAIAKKLLNIIEALEEHDDIVTVSPNFNIDVAEGSLE